MSDCHFDLTCRLAEKINPDKWCKSVDVETENLNFSMSDLRCTVRINDDKGNAYSFGTGSQYVDDLSVSKVDITPGCKVEFRSTNSYGHSTLKHLEYGMGMGATDLSLENINKIEVHRDKRECINVLALTNYVCKDKRNRGYDESCLPV